MILFHLILKKIFLGCDIDRDQFCNFLERGFIKTMGRMWIVSSRMIHISEVLPTLRDCTGAEY